MKRFGILQTLSPAEKTEESALLYDPRKDFVAIFKWPYNEGISIFVERVTQRHHSKLWEILETESPRGWAPVHFAVLDHFCALHELSLSIIQHEHRILNENTSSKQHLYETILSGDWTPKKTK